METKNYDEVETIKNKYTGVRGEVLANSNELNAQYIKNLMPAVEAMAFREGMYKQKNFWILKTAAALFYGGDKITKILKDNKYSGEDRKVVLSMIKNVKNQVPKTNLESILSDAVKFVDKKTILF